MTENMIENEPMTLTSEQVNHIRLMSKEAIERADALKRLYNNSDFKLVFIKRYIEDESKRLVSLLANHTFNLGGKKSEHREEILERMIGIARFNMFVQEVENEASRATKNLEDLLEAEKAYYSESVEEF